MNPVENIKGICIIWNNFKQMNPNWMRFLIKAVHDTLTTPIRELRKSKKSGQYNAFTNALLTLKIF